MKKAILVLSSMFVLNGCNLGINFVEKDQHSSQEETKSKEPTVQNQSIVNEPVQPELTLEAVFFNEIVQVDGKNIIQNPDNMLTLVNKVFALPEDYEPQDLVRPNVTFSFGEQDVEKSYLRQEAATALEKMFAEAKNNDIHLFAVSGYRSYDRQNDNYQYKLTKMGVKEAVKLVASPGNSEHQTGLAMDISSESANYKLTEQFGETAEGKWLKENAHRFGFILRYPKGLEMITGYNYEPWHFRYVGQKIATEMYQNQLTLEEYFNLVKKI